MKRLLSLTELPDALLSVRPASELVTRFQIICLISGDESPLAHWKKETGAL